MKITKTPPSALDTERKQPVVSIRFPFEQPLLKGTVLAADIGGSQTRLALFKRQGSSFELIEHVALTTKDFSSFQEAFRVFYQPGWPPIDRVCVGVAGPVVDGKVEGTNFPWAISEASLKEIFPHRPVFLLNDLEASAYGLAGLEEKDLLNIHQGKQTAGNVALIAPGTGLGEVGLFFDGHKLRPFATEGGHCDFSPRHELECELFTHLHFKFGHVSWERLISGPGISRIYEFLTLKRGEVFASMPRHTRKVDDPSLISRQAAEGSCIISKETMNLFFKFLAVECAQLALKMKAVGGIYIGGGIVPQVLASLDKADFRSHFTQAGRMCALLDQIPIKIILQENTPLWGAAYYACGGVPSRKTPEIN